MTLVNEINAEEGSFLLQLKTEHIWNHNAFIRLLSFIYYEYINTKYDQKISREYVFGIWFLYEFSRDYALNFMYKELDEKYYEKAIEVFHDLIFVYFSLDSIYLSDEILLEKINNLAPN